MSLLLSQLATGVTHEGRGSAAAILATTGRCARLRTARGTAAARAFGALTADVLRQILAPTRADVVFARTTATVTDAATRSEVTGMRTTATRDPAAGGPGAIDP